MAVFVLCGYRSLSGAHGFTIYGGSVGPAALPMLAELVLFLSDRLQNVSECTIGRQRRARSARKAEKKKKS